jgi:hypothetical protein
MAQNLGGNGPFINMSNMTISHIGADFGVEKTGIEKLQEAFDKANGVQAPKTLYPPLHKKKKLGTTNTVPAPQTYSQLPCPGHLWISAGMRPLHSSMDSEAVLICPNCDAVKLIRIQFQYNGSGGGGGLGAYGGPGGGGGNTGGGSGGNYSGNGGFITTSGSSKSTPWDPNDPNNKNYF